MRSPPAQLQIVIGALKIALPPPLIQSSLEGNSSGSKIISSNAYKVMETSTREEAELVSELSSNKGTGKVSTAILRTDDRILARITDGIYRQPASALRELISNAYDADATTVIIQTDAPRFDHILIRDDGNGMDIAALARLIHHIGGSTKKRKIAGAQIGTTSELDPTLSPKGRKLIGKIGIGLFSVSQLTRHFQIVTKVKGNNYRLIAEVVLRTYNEDELASGKSPADGKVETGIVNITSVPATDLDTHGTDIVLMDLRQQSKELLQSKELWDSLSGANVEGSSSLRSPTFHIGKYDHSTGTIVTPSALPWGPTDEPHLRFNLLFQGIIDTIGTVEQNPRLETTLDNYLRTLWTLSLSAPLDYIESHPFDIAVSDFDTYQFSSAPSGQAKKVLFKSGQTVRSALDLVAPQRGNAGHTFKVLIDDIELRRPIRFRDLPKTSQALKKPMLFVGKAHPDLSKISAEERGGELAFEAYFLWTPKVVPKENNGLLIRIGDASGTLFDSSFARYQVAENNRLTQITAEIFVIKGLDPALNIDRESFNTSHPHYQFIMRWVHRALRQLVNTLKQTASAIRVAEFTKASAEREKTLESLMRTEVARVSKDPDGTPTDVEISGDKNSISSERQKGRLVLDSRKIFPTKPPNRRTTKKAATNEHLFKRQIEAIAQLLDAYGLLSDLSYEKQEELFSGIVKIFSVGK